MQNFLTASFEGLLSGQCAHPAVILVATSLDDLDQLMPFAMLQARHNETRLILLHVMQNQLPLGTIDQAVLPFYDPSSALDAASRTLEAYCEEARSCGLTCDALLREGVILQQITAVARQFSADCLLLGTRNHSRLGKLLLGSVAEQVLRSINLPVITVGPEAHLPESRNDHQPVVLHATTLRESAQPGAALACQAASSLGARLVLLHVLPPVDTRESEISPNGLATAAMNELQELARQTAGSCGIAIESRIVHGNPHIEILAQTVELQASLLVLGAGSRRPLEHLTRDRVALRVLAHARCPVMTLPGGYLLSDTHAGAAMAVSRQVPDI